MDQSNHTINYVAMLKLMLIVLCIQTVDPNKPCTMVFCCVDPAKYIDSYDIGEPKQNM